jgi:phage/plasmid-like protein (TIGR03299 family)
MTTITETPVATQAAAKALVRRIPWHGIATIQNDQAGVLSKPLLEQGGLDWDVAVRPLYRTMTDGTVVQSDRDYEVYRVQDEYQLGTVRTRYTPGQNREIFAFGDILVDKGLGKWVAAGQQYGGSRVLMVMQVADEFNILGDPHRMFIIFRGSHDGSLAIRADAVPFRMNCFNQNHLVTAKARSSWKVLHVGTLEAKLAQAQDSLEMAVAYRDEYIQVAESLAKVDLPQAAGYKLIDKMVKKDRTRRDEVIADLQWNWHNSQTIPEDWRWTGLGLLNATTEYFGHIARRQGDGNSLYESVMNGEAKQARDILTRALAKH